MFSSLSLSPPLPPPKRKLEAEQRNAVAEHEMEIRQLQAQHDRKLGEMQARLDEVSRLSLLSGSLPPPSFFSLLLSWCSLQAEREHQAALRSLREEREAEVMKAQREAEVFASLFSLLL